MTWRISSAKEPEINFAGSTGLLVTTSTCSRRLITYRSQKMKCLRINLLLEESFLLDYVDLEDVNSFTYLGCILCKYGSIEQDI